MRKLTPYEQVSQALHAHSDVLSGNFTTRIMQLVNKATETAYNIGREQGHKDGLIVCEIGLDLVNHVLYEQPNDEIAQQQKKIIEEALAKLDSD